MTLTLVELDPSSCILDGNPRSKAGDTAQLQKSIEQLGVLVPIIVRAEGDKYRVLAGQRRVLAATAAGAALPAIVHDGLDTEVAALEAALAENLARVPLSDADEARGYEQLAAFGLDEAAIADALSSTPARVKQGLAVAASAEALKRAVKNQLTLEQAAAVAEFDGVKGAVTKIMETIKWRPRDLDHTVAQLRQEVRDEEKFEKATARFKDQGVPILKTAPDAWRAPSLTTTARLDKLTDDKGKALTGTNHRKCPGHAVALYKTWDGLQQVFVCTDPKGNGHKIRAGEKVERSTRPKPDEDRAEVVAGNKAWRAAEGVRRTFVAGLIARRKAPDNTLQYLADAMLNGYVSFGRGRANTGELTEPAEHVVDRVQDADDPMKVTPAHALLALLAQHALDVEGNMDVTTWRHAHRAGDPARWLRFLESNGYELSEIERKVVDAKR